MKRNVLMIAAFVSLVCSPAVRAELLIDDAQKFQQRNPDGQKYEFLKVYLKSLSYLHKATQSRTMLNEFGSKNMFAQKRLKLWNDHLNKENFNLRIARNTLDKSSFAQNGLMVKAIDLFEQMCNEHIAYNQEERALMDSYKDRKVYVQVPGGVLSANPFNTAMQQELLAIEYKRKDSSKRLIEIADLVEKILISNQVDSFGEFVRLGITVQERKEILRETNHLYPPRKKKGLQAGQTFIEGSVISLREILEDTSWQSLDS